jgi:hypothetical protein
MEEKPLNIFKPEYWIDHENEKINPNISVDCVVFGFDLKELKVLLVDRILFSPDNERIIFQDKSLPGNHCMDDENIDQSANRILKELTGLTDVHLEQFAAFGDIDRLKKEKDQIWLKAIKKNPDARVLTVAYYALVAVDKIIIDTDAWKSLPGWYGKRPQWYGIRDIPDLAFDHKEIILTALDHLREKVVTQPIIFKLLPDKFTLGQLQKIYEVVLDTKLDKRNFRKKITNANFIIPLRQKEVGVSHKPAQLYRFDLKKFEKRSKNLFNLCRF